MTSNNSSKIYYGEFDDGEIHISCDFFTIDDIEVFDLGRWITKNQMKNVYEDEMYLYCVYISYTSRDETYSMKINSISLEMEGDDEVMDFFSPINDTLEIEREVPLRFKEIRKLSGLLPDNIKIEIIRNENSPLSELHLYFEDGDEIFISQLV